LLALPLLYGLKAPRRLARLALIAAAAFVVASRLQTGAGDVAHERNFYGTLQVSDSGTGETAIRTLYNGRTLHGVEFQAPSRLRWPTAYFGPDSGAGRVLQQGTAPRRVGVVGLGAGTLAAYARAGDAFRFYEINPAVIQVAEHDFHFIDSAPARIDVVPGDGRLSLEREPAASFDVLILDAFADDSIPVHLLTREAFALYFRVLRPGGVLAIHITNRYLDLAPIVEALGNSFGKQVTPAHNDPDPDRQILAADWMIVSGHAEPRAPSRLWTDDYSNLFQALK
jgi:SAM-dependent methyltransferase